MTWAHVSANIEFWTTSSTWGGGLYSAFPSSDETLIRNALEALYNGSAKAAEALELATASGTLPIGQAAFGSLAFYHTADGSIGYNLSAIQALRYFNSHGAFVNEILGISLIHEIVHKAYAPGMIDLVPGIDLNAADVDQQGPTVRVQNIISQQMGWTDNLQVSYRAGTAAAAWTSHTEFIAVSWNSRTPMDARGSTLVGPAGLELPRLNCSPGGKVPTMYQPAF